jgi:hypothetical protein
VACVAVACAAVACVAAVVNSECSVLIHQLHQKLTEKLTDGARKKCQNSGGMYSLQ